MARRIKTDDGENQNNETAVEAEETVTSEGDNTSDETTEETVTSEGDNTSDETTEETVTSEGDNTSEGDETSEDDTDEDEYVPAVYSKESDPLYYGVQVLIVPLAGTKAERDGTEPMSVLCERLARGEFVTSGGDPVVTGKADATAEKSVRNWLSAMLYKPRQFALLGLDYFPELEALPKEGSNTKADDKNPLDNPVFAEEMAVFARGMRDAALDAKTHETGGRSAWIALGSAASKAQAKLIEADGGKLNLHHWGAFITSHKQPGGAFFGVPVLAGNSGQNTIGEAIVMADAPDYLMEIVPPQYIAPKSFINWRDSQKNEAARLIVGSLLAAKLAKREESAAEGGNEYAEIVTSAKELAAYSQLYFYGTDEKPGYYTREVLNKETTAEGIAKLKNMDDDRKADMTAADVLLSDATFAKYPSAKAVCTVFKSLVEEANLPAEDDPLFDNTYNSSRIGKAVVKQWQRVRDEQAQKDRIAKTNAGKSEEEIESEKRTAADKETATVLRRAFEDLTIPEAATRLANLIGNHEDATEILMMAAEILENRNNASETEEVASEEGATA